MKRIFSVFFNHVKALNSAASDVKTVDGAFKAMIFLMYFLLTPFIDLGEWVLKINIGVAGTIGIWVVLSYLLYQELVRDDKWREILRLYPMSPVSKGYALFWSGLWIVFGLFLVLFPLGRMLNN